MFFVPRWAGAKWRWVTHPTHTRGSQGARWRVPGQVGLMLQSPVAAVGFPSAGPEAGEVDTCLFFPNTQNTQNGARTAGERDGDGWHTLPTPGGESGCQLEGWGPSRANAAVPSGSRGISIGRARGW